MFEKFRPSGTPAPTGYGKDRDYCIDLVPKFAMAAGEFVSILVHTDVTRYVDFQQVAGSFVFRAGKGISKVPSTEYEAATSPLMGLFEKRRAKGFFEYLQKADPENPGSWGEWNLMVMPMSELFGKFGLENGTQDFIGHSLALHLDEGYLAEPAIETVRRIRLYMSSMARFGKSPYVYPLYGLSELPQGFARLSAIYGGTYMLGQPVDGLVYGPDGRVCGVRSGESVAKCSAVFADPSYVPDQVRFTHQVVRAYCLLDHPIPDTGNADSCQIILPQRQLNRRFDVYVACVSHHHNVCASGFWLATVSTIVETANPEAELQGGLALLGPIREKWIHVSNLFEPASLESSSGVFISRSLDPTSHFETVCEDVKRLYHAYTGHDLVLRKRPTQEEEQAMLGNQIGSVSNV